MHFLNSGQFTVRCMCSFSTKVVQSMLILSQITVPPQNTAKLGKENDLKINHLYCDNKWGYHRFGSTSTSSQFLVSVSFILCKHMILFHILIQVNGCFLQQEQLERSKL